MGSVSTFVRLIKNRDKVKMNRAIADKLMHSGLSSIIPDKKYIKTIFKLMLGKKLNLKSPRTFNEKLQWLKLYNRHPEYRRMVDKHDVKEYVSEIIGGEYIVPTLGVWNSFDEIDFDKLPDRFVLKCTHDSGSVVICKNKKEFDRESAREKIEKGLKNDLFWFGREWPYKGLERRIIAEQYLEDESTGELRDYKFFCFNGKVKCFKVDFDRFINHRANYFDRGNRLMKFGEEVCPPDYDREIEIPGTIEIMKELAEKLSDGIPFLRADFYDANGQIYFGELTFFPASGFGAFIPDEWDELLGAEIELPEKEKKQ